MNWDSVRAEFPVLRDWTYLNTATFGHVPLRSQRAVEQHFARRNELACSDFLQWFDDADDVRALLGKLMNCDGSDIAFLATAAAALSLFLGGLDWKPGDRIVTLRNEFPNQFYYANWLQSRGAELIERHEIDTIPSGTRAVVLSSVNYRSGYRPDIAQISSMAHNAGALVYVDATQSLGALRFDVQQARPDVVACDPYKWLLTPNGASFFYISKELQVHIPPQVIGWRSDKGWRSVEELNPGTPQLPETAERYEGGMLNFPSLYALRESVQMILEIGPDRIEQRVLSLAEQTAQLLSACGGEVQHGNTNIVAARFPSAVLTRIAEECRASRILTAQRHGNLRVSPHFYNNEADLEALAAALRRAA